MTDILVLVRAVLEAFAFIVLYVFVGFGPGFVLGIIAANVLLARGKPTLMEGHNEAKQLAAQHNAQWSPSHERWQTSDGGQTHVSPPPD